MATSFFVHSVLSFLSSLTGEVKPDIVLKRISGAWEGQLLPRDLRWGKGLSLDGLIPSPKFFPYHLSGIYDNMGVQPNPVVSRDGKLFLKRDSSLVREHFNAAAATLVRLFEEARKRDEAAELRDKLIRLYSVPPDVFSRKS